MIKNFCVLFLLMSGFSSLALSDTDKDVTVDQAIGGMEEGRRISGPVSYSSKDIASEKHGSFANPVTDAHAHPFMQVTGNRGYMYINAAANGPQNAINRSGNQQTSGALNASTGTNPAQAGSSIPPTVQTHTGVEATGPTAGTVQAVIQQTGGPSNVGTQAGQTVTEHTSGPVSTGTQIGQTVPEQTSGPVNVNTAGEAHGNGGVLIGGETSPVNAPTGTTTQEPSGTSGSSNNPIVAVEANTNPTSGTPNVSVHTDTIGQLEDRQIVGAGVTGAVTGSTGAQVGSASEITGSNTVHNADVTTQPVTGTTGQTVPEQTGGSVTTETGNQGYITGQAGTTETNPTGSVSTGGTQEPSGTSGASNNPIVSVEAGTNPAAGTPNASVHTDTSGQLEDRQIVNAGVAGAGTGSSGTQVGSASEITGSNTVHNADVTTQPVTGATGPTIPSTTEVQTGSSSGTTTQEPSGASSNPIVTVDTNVNPSAGAPTASVHTDTSGQLEDRQIVGAGVTGAATGSTGTQVGSASEITGSNTVHNADLTTQPVTGNGGNLIGGETSTVNAPTGTTTQETSGTSSNPIVAVEANTNPTSGTPNASVHTDTSGQLEDRQIIGAGVAGTGSTGTQVGSASEITGSNTVHNADVTTQPVTGTTGQTVPEQAGTTATIPVSTTTQEPSGTSGASNNPIVAVEANTNPTSGTPTATVHTDTSGQLEDRQIANAGVAGAVTGSSGTQVGSASEITGSNTVHNADVTTQPVTSTTGQTVPEQTGGSVATETGNQGYITGQAGTTETNPTGSISTGGTQEPSGTSGASNNPIVAVEANTNPTSGTPNASVHTDTSGQLEDRQIANAGVAGSGTGSSGTQVGSASEITGSNTVHNADVTTQPATGTTGQTIPEQTGGTVATQAQEGSATDVTGQELVQEADVTTEQATTGTSQTVPEQFSAGSGTTTQEPSGTSGNPIVGVETGANPEAGTPTVGASVDTTGEVEDRQFLQTDLASEGIASSGQVGSASDTTGSSVVHGADITTQPVASTTGQAITGTTTEAQAGSSSSGTTTQGQSGGSNNPIVAVDTNVNPASGTPNAGVQVNTSGQLEDRQIVDAGVAGPGAGSSGTQVGSASEITGSGTVGGLDVTAQPVQSDISAPSGIGAEVDTTGQSVGAAADVGVQADVSGVSDSSDVAKKDSADGLNLGTTTHTGL